MQMTFTLIEEGGDLDLSNILVEKVCGRKLSIFQTKLPASSEHEARATNLRKVPDDDNERSDETSTPSQTSTGGSDPGGDDPALDSDGSLHLRPGPDGSPMASVKKSDEVSWIDSFRREAPLISIAIQALNTVILTAILIMVCYWMRM